MAKGSVATPVCRYCGKKLRGKNIRFPKNLKGWTPPDGWQVVEETDSFITFGEPGFIGFNGNGFFCSHECGFEFAVRALKNSENGKK